MPDALPLTENEMRDIATELILSHGYDVEYSTVREEVSENYSRNMSDETRKAVVTRIYDLTVAAEVTVTFPEGA
jgi:hypothetical protein